MPLRVFPLRPASAPNYDLLIGAVGFESRSLHVPTHIGAHRVCLFPYSTQSSTIFRQNLALAESLKHCDLRPSPTLIDFRSEVARVLSSVSDGQRIAIDISSFDRRRIATLLELAVERGNSLSALTVDLLYSPAEFSPPPAHLEGSPLEAGPIGDAFHGHLRRTSLPLAAIFGLGYEPQRAIGSFELLEPSRAWAFWPDSNDARYEESLQLANRLLLSLFSASDVLSYPVLDPGDAYYRLESLVTGLSTGNRVVLVPMGPKIFAACCILLGLSNEVDRPAVWRIGVAGRPVAVDSRPRGEIVGLTVLLGEHNQSGTTSRQ